MKEHGELKLMRSGLCDGKVWWAVRECNGIVTERWPLDGHSIEQLEWMRAGNLAREPDVGAEKGAVARNDDQMRAMCRLLIAEGHMTPMAERQILKVWDAATSKPSAREGETL